MADDQDTSTQMGDAALGQLPPMSNTERIWLLCKLNPGIATFEIAEQAAAAGIPPGSVSSLLAQLQAKHRLRRTGKFKIRPVSNKPNDCYEAVGGTKNTELQAFLANLKGLQDAAKSADPQAQPPASEPQAEPSDESWRHRSRVQWKEPEWDALMLKLVRDEIMLGTEITTARILELAHAGGEGFRARPMHSISGGLAKLLEDRKEQLTKLRRQVTRQWNAEQKAAEPTAQESAPTPAEAPAQAPAEAARIEDKIGDGLKLEDVGTATELAGAPLNEAALDGMQMVMRGVMLMVQGVFAGLMDEQLTRTRNELNAHTDERVSALESRLVTVIQAAAGASAPRTEHVNFMDKILHPVPLTLGKHDPAPPGGDAKREARKKQVIIVSATATQFEVIKSKFPTLDLRLVTGRVPQEQQPDLVVGLTRFMDHTVINGIKRKFGEIYMPVHGAATTVAQAIAARLGVPMAY